MRVVGSEGDLRAPATIEIIRLHSPASLNGYIRKRARYRQRCPIANGIMREPRPNIVIGLSGVL
jgi:hypothetical protein